MKKSIRTLAIILLGGLLTVASIGADRQSEFIPSVMSYWESHTTPSIGKLNIPVFFIDFPDAKYANTVLDIDELEQVIFSEECEGSVSAFYNTSSYGNLDISGDVFSYTAQKDISAYENEAGYENLSMEVLKAFDDEVDYTVYDSDKDGILDAYILCVPTGGDADFWYGCQATWYQNEDFKVDGMKPLYYVMCDSQADRGDIKYFQKTLYHELGHCMGLPDYYKYDNDYDWDGMHGIAGLEVMDDMEGDFSQFSKLQLGWLKENQVQVYQYEGEKSYLIPKASDGGCLVIFPKQQTDMSDFQSEYFLVEYDTPEGNFADCFSEEEAGVRILHVQAEWETDGWEYYYKYNNYAPGYDTSDEGIRVVRRVNDESGFYHPGDSVSYGEAEFEWYDESVQEELVIVIESFDKSGAHVTVRKK